MPRWIRVDEHPLSQLVAIAARTIDSEYSRASTRTRRRGVTQFSEKLVAVTPFVAREWCKAEGGVILADRIVTRGSSEGNLQSGQSTSSLCANRFLKVPKAKSVQSPSWRDLPTSIEGETEAFLAAARIARATDLPDPMDPRRFRRGRLGRSNAAAPRSHRSSSNWEPPGTTRVRDPRRCS